MLLLPYFAQTSQFNTRSSISDDIPGQCNTSLALQLHFSIPKCELCMIRSISARILVGIMTRSPLKSIPWSIEILSR